MNSAVFNENIYNLIPSEQQKAEKAARYQSRFKKNVKEEYSSDRHDKKTMGPAKVDVAGPDDFLKKRSKEPKMPEKTGFKYPDDARKKPAVPKPNDQPLMGLKTTKNFVTQNAVENIMSVAKKAEKNMVDTRNGDKITLESSGLEPKYRNKKEFGKVPQYLVTRQEEIRAAQEEYDNYISEMYRKGAMQCLTESERQEIIRGLKQNWQDYHHQYQSLSVMVDTIPKKNRKEWLENEMKQLERDIDSLEKHDIIYISN